MYILILVWVNLSIDNHVSAEWPGSKYETFQECEDDASRLWRDVLNASAWTDDPAQLHTLCVNVAKEDLK